jgi:hypothetical protein
MPSTSWDGSILPGGAGASNDAYTPTEQMREPQSSLGSYYAQQQYGSAPQSAIQPRFGAPPQFAAPSQVKTPAGFVASPRTVRARRDNRAFLRAGVCVVIAAAVAVAGYVVVPHLTKKAAIPVPNRTVSLPSKMQGQTALNEPQLVQDMGLAAWVAKSPVPVVDADVTVYGAYQHPFFVVAAAKLTKHVSAAGQTAYITTYAARGTAFASVTPGPYGGQMACSTTTTGATCISIDDVAEVLVYVYIPETQQNAALLTSQAIAAIEH